MSSYYLHKALNPKSLNRIATETVKIARKVNAELIVVRGLSGILVAAAAGSEYGVPFAIVRKPGESTHASSGLEISYNDSDCSDDDKYANWIIVDDFISSGATMKAIFEEVENNARRIKGKCVGIVLYNGSNENSVWDRTESDSIPIYRIIL